MQAGTSFSIRWSVKLTLSLIVGGIIIFSGLPSVQGFFNPQSPAPTPDQIEFFEKKIRPLFAANCQKCHNAKAQVAQLDLTSAEGFLRGGESGSLINKDKPELSRLLRVISFDESTKMPPSGKLKPEEISDLTNWIKMGAPWPATTAAATTPWPKNSSVRSFTEEEKNFWSFQPLKNPELPKVKNEAWIISPIDRFILARLEEKNISPAPAADKLTLLRRATFDLTGLPPSEKEIKDFLADHSPKAFEKVIDRLLASPRYGEKWGRNWLDVARYADSTGNDEDHRYPHAWKYRDYVIKAFNDDMPYDQFVREQIAGDLMPSADGGEVNRRGIIATGFLALGAKAIAQQDKKKMLYDVYDEQLDVSSKALLGLTMACARCHNHKFDPILTKDYYSMIAMFASTRSFSNAESHVSVPLEKPLVPKAQWEAYLAAKKSYGEKDKKIRVASEEIIDEVKEKNVRENLPRLADLMLAARRVYRENIDLQTVATQADLPPNLLKKWVDFLKPGLTVRGYLNEWNEAPPSKLQEVARAYQTRFQKHFDDLQKRIVEWRPKYQKALIENKPVPEKPKFEAGLDRFFADVYNDGPYAISGRDKNNFSADQWAKQEALRKEADELKKTAPVEPEMACAIEDGASVQQKVFIRGDYNNGGEDAPQAFPAILANYDSKPQFFGSGRLQFAEWLTRPQNPLPSRVMANRLWLWHFGEGIVRTPDNFGKMGERPTHPELLDFLASEFIRNGYSIKAMHRLLMLSSTYQMASDNPALVESDPDNRLFSHFNRRRLTVEEMRDALLAIDGTIDFTMGGSLQTGRGTDGENNQGRLSLNPEKLTRRTVYLPLRRANLPTLLNLFDFGDATSMQGKRQLTNVATQALFWLNSEFLSERADNVAKLIWGTQTLRGNPQKIEMAYTYILNRNVEKDEIEAALKYIDGAKQKFTGEHAERKAWQSFCRVLMASNDFVYVD